MQSQGSSRSNLFQTQGASRNNLFQSQPHHSFETNKPIKGKVLTVYLILICGLVISAITVTVLSDSAPLVKLVKEHFIPTMIGTSFLMTINTSIFNKMPYDTHMLCKAISWVINCMLAAVPMLVVQESMLIKSGFYTLGLILILSLKSFIIPEKVIEAYIHPLTAIHTLVLACTVYSVLFNSLDVVITPVFEAVCLYAGFIVYAGLLICNTHRLCLNAKHPYFDPIFSAFIFYMNILNLYSRVIVYTSKHSTLTIQEKGCRRY